MWKLDLDLESRECLSMELKSSETPRIQLETAIYDAGVRFGTKICNIAAEDRIEVITKSDNRDEIGKVSSELTMLEL